MRTWYLTLRGPVSVWDGRIIRWVLWLAKYSGASKEMIRNAKRACREQQIPYRQTNGGLEIAHYGLKGAE